jgi:hypothetical protein
LLTKSQTCWKCKKRYSTPPILKIKNKNNNVTSAEIAVAVNKRLITGHFKKDEPIAESKILGVFVSHPKDPKSLGLRNDSNRSWAFTNAKGETIPVDVGRAVPVNPNNEVDFGNNSVGIFESGA